MNEYILLLLFLVDELVDSVCVLCFVSLFCGLHVNIVRDVFVLT